MSKTATATADADAGSKKKSKLLLAIVAGVVLLAAGIGAGAWYTMRSMPVDPAAQPKKPPAFVTLEPFVVNLRGVDSDHYLQLGVVLEVTEAEVVDAVKQQMPRIRNGILLLLSSKTVPELSTVEGKQALMEQIVAEARKPMTLEEPSKGIASVYFSAFVIQ